MRGGLSDESWVLLKEVLLARLTVCILTDLGCSPTRASYVGGTRLGSQVEKYLSSWLISSVLEPRSCSLLGPHVFMV